MKRNDIKALHDKDLKELNEQLRTLLLDLAKARLEKKAAKLANVSLVRQLSDDVARVKTVIHEKEILERAQSLIASMKEVAQKSEKPETEKTTETPKKKTKKTKKETK